MSLLPLLLALLLALPAAVDLELADATLAEAASALAAKGVPAVCVEDGARRVTLRFAGQPPERAAELVAEAFGVPMRVTSGRYALGGSPEGAAFLLLDTGDTQAVALLSAGQTLEVLLDGRRIRAVPLLFGEKGGRR